MSVPEPGLEILPGLTLLRPLGRGGWGGLARSRRRAGRGRGGEGAAGGAPAERVALLRREARLVRKLAHPRIVPVYGFRSGERASAVTLRLHAGRRRLPAGAGAAPRGRPTRPGRGRGPRIPARPRRRAPRREALERPPRRGGRAHLADFGIAAVLSGDEDGVVLRGGGSRASMSPQQRAGAVGSPGTISTPSGRRSTSSCPGRPPFSPEATDQEILAR